LFIVGVLDNIKHHSIDKKKKR